MSLLSRLLPNVVVFQRGCRVGVSTTKQYKVLPSLSSGSCRPYGGSVSGSKVINSRYLIVSGSISLKTIQECLAEFFNPTHCEGKELASFLESKQFCLSVACT